MIRVCIDESDALNMLMDRLADWTADDIATHLYEQMYESYIEGRCFDGAEFNPSVIVDNDWVNCEVVCKGDEFYDEIKRIYEEQGLGDCSFESENFDFIEAEYKGSFLCRW